MDVGKSKLKCDIFVAGGPGQCYIIAVRTVQWFQLVQRVATRPGLKSMAEYVLCSSTVSPLTSFRAFAKSTSATANKPNIQVVTTMNQLVQNSSGISDKISKPGQRIRRCPQVQNKFLYFHSKGGRQMGVRWYVRCTRYAVRLAGSGRAPPLLFTLPTTPRLAHVRNQIIAVAQATRQWGFRSVPKREKPNDDPSQIK